MIHALLLAAATLTPAQVDAVLANVEKSLSSYVFPDVGAKTVAMLKANAAKYEAITDPAALQKTVNTDLYASTHDKHVTLWYPIDPRDSDDDNSAAARAQRKSDNEAFNYGFADVRRLSGNVGYLDVRGFSDDPAVADTIEAAMTFLKNTDALIIDLRKNGGGDPQAAQQLAGYFFDRAQPMSSPVFRDPATGKYSQTKRFTANVTGPKYLNKPVYILTSDFTISCAEQFTYDMKNLRRATVVGETTAGGANPGQMHYAGDRFGVFVPQGYAKSPITGTNWEGVGVKPDVAALSADALKDAYTAALHYVAQHSTNENVREQVATVLQDVTKYL